jgi:predicted nucleic acid-binding protein
MIVLDTNVVSELMKADPEPTVLAWMDAQPMPSMFLSAISKGEILYGVALVPTGKRQTALLRPANTAFDSYFPGRVLPFDAEAAEAYALIAATRRQSGRPVGQADAQIAAIARSRGADVATRNVADFEGCGITVIDPWAAS